MNVHVREPFFDPIRQYLWIDPSVPVDGVNDLVNQINKALAALTAVAGGGYLGIFPTASLPTAGVAFGSTAFASDARKVAEAPGAGTGIMVYYSSLGWRAFSADQSPAT